LSVLMTRMSHASDRSRQPVEENQLGKGDQNEEKAENPIKHYKWNFANDGVAEKNIGIEKEWVLFRNYRIWNRR
jgi:hypothetical protein